jgi:type I restriction enzyme S subunit
MSFPLVPLRRLVKLVNGGTPSGDLENWGGDIPWATPTDLARANGRALSTTERTLSEEGLRSGSATVPQGALIMSTRAPIGYVIRVEAPVMALNQGCRGLIANSRVEAAFLQYWLICQAEPIQSLGTGSTFVELSTPSLQQVLIPLPEIPEQRRITAFLDDQVSRIDQVIAFRKRQIDLMLESAKASEHSLVWRGIRSSITAPVPIDPVGEAPAHWARVRNKNLLAESRDLSLDGSEELLTVSHITGITLRSDKNVSMFMAETNEGYVNVKSGDLVINTMWAWMGALGISSLDGIVSPAYGVYRPRDRATFESDYFDALYRSPAYVCEMARFSTGVWSSRLRIYPDVFLALPVVAPPIEEQRAIASRIREARDAANQRTSLLERSIDLLTERRRSLITAAMSGELDPATMSTRAGRVTAS